MKYSLFILACLLAFTSCKKSTGPKPIKQPPAGHVKHEKGAPIAAAVKSQIGSNGGKIISADGVLTVTIPAGAVESTQEFSIQQVENVLGNGVNNYRLLPEGINFKKPVTITYFYGGQHIESMHADFLFLTYQDAEGYYYAANKTRGNKANATLTVETTHFSDWTFFSEYSIYVPASHRSNGDIRLGESESVILTLLSIKPGNKEQEYSELPDLKVDPLVYTATWDYTPKKGTLTKIPDEARVEYKAPVEIQTSSRVLVTVSINGNIGKDNMGNSVNFMQIVQGIRLETGGYFILSEDGEDNLATSFSAHFLAGFGSQLNAKFPNGYNLSCYTYYGSIGIFPYRQHGTEESAALELVVDENTSYIVYRPTTCDDNNNTLSFSPGYFEIESLGEGGDGYVRGHFSATIFRYGYCEKPGSKTISGRFRIKRRS